MLSLYLRLSPERRVREAWRSAFHSLASAALRRIADRRERQAVKDELDRVEHALEAELPELGRGVAFFVCRRLGLWRQIAVPVALPDGVHFGARPHLRPLVRTRDEHDRFVLALLSQEHSRFFISQIGVVEEVLRVNGQRPRGMPTDRVPRDRRDVLMTEARRHEARVLAHAAALVLAQFEGRYLLIAAPPELRAAVMRDLPKDVAERIGGDFAVEVHARPAEVAAAAEPAQRAIEAREEAATVRRLIDAGPRHAAWGEQPTLDALRDSRVMTLAVDDAFSKPGARCGDCGALWHDIAEACPACGSNAIRPVEDVVELALEQGLEQKAGRELVRSHEARRSMAQIGPMAALLRW